MKRVFLSLIVALMLGPAILATAQAQSVSDVLKSFRKLEADTEAGMNHGEYIRGLAEVNAQLKNYSDATQGKPPSPAIQALRAAFDSYLSGKALWDQQRLQDMRYENSEVSIKQYFDEKAANSEAISRLWEKAGGEIDRAASLVNATPRTKTR